VRKAALFSGYLTDGNGVRRRATRQELREATRLYWRHKDLRQRTARSCPETQPARALAPELDDVVADELDQLGIDSLGAA
jgi:hypothetical protein